MQAVTLTSNPRSFSKRSRYGQHKHTPRTIDRRFFFTINLFFYLRLFFASANRFGRRKNKQTDQRNRYKKGRLLRRQLDEAEAVKAQLLDEVAAVRSQREAAELERHKLVLAHQTEAAATHVQVSRGKKEDHEQDKKKKGEVKGPERFSLPLLYSVGYLFGYTYRRREERGREGRGGGPQKGGE